MALLLLPLAIYIPPVQQWAVNRASRYASEATGMDISVERVSLAFPLDLCVEGVKVVRQNDSLPAVKDTIALVQRAVVDVQLLPLLDSEVRINAVELLQARLNTSDFIHEARIKGSVGRLAIENDHAPVVEINLPGSTVDLASILLDDAHLNIELSDTVPPDTTESKTAWAIKVKGLCITRSDVLLHMPGDTLQVGAAIGELTAKNGFFDLSKGLYDVASVALSRSVVSYDNNFADRLENGLDPNHISLTDVSLKLDSVHYCAPDMRVLVRNATMKEKSGLQLSSLLADVVLDSTQVRLNGTLMTPVSRIATKVQMDLNAFDSVSPGKVKADIDASLGRQDLLIAMADVPQALRNAWPAHPLCIKGQAAGNLREVMIPWLTVELPTVFALDAKGDARGFMALADNFYSNDFSAKMHADLTTYNMSFVKSLLDRNTAAMLNIPSLHAVADIDVHGGDYAFDVRAMEGKGSVQAKGRTNIAAMSYDAVMKVNSLNLGHFVRGMQLGSFTGGLRANGQGTDYKSHSTRMQAEAKVDHFTYGKYNLNNITADVTMKNGKADLAVVSKNELVDGTIGLNALIDRNRLEATFTTDLHSADLYKLFLVDAPLQFALCAHVDVESDFNDYNMVHGLVSDITFIDSAKTYRPDDIVLDLLTRLDTTAVKMYCGDLEMRLNAQGGYKKLLGTSDRLMAAINSQMEQRTIDQTELRALLPNMQVHLKCSDDNPFYRMLKYYDLDYHEVNADFSTSMEDGINGRMWLYGLSTQGYKLDTIRVEILSTSDPNTISYKGEIQNRKPNEYVFDAMFNGEVLEHGLSFNTQVYDAKGQLGLRLGAEATMVEEGIHFMLTPNRPVLGYQEFALNDSNYIMLGRNGKVWADVVLLADDGTGLKIYSADDEDAAERLQDLTLTLNKLDIGRLTSAIPYVPSIAGMLNGDVHFMQEADESFSLSTDLTVNNMVYEGSKMGDVGLVMVYMPKDNGYHYVDGYVTRNGVEVANITGSYNFDNSDLDTDVSFIRFPMEMLNGFVPDQIIGLEGTAEGTLTVHGTTTKPEVNGELFLESASLISVPYGVKMRFDDDPIRIVDSKLLLENFQMYGSNDAPLLMYGSIDFGDTEHINVNLRMKAENFLLVDSKETRRSEAYGKGYITFYALMNGELDKLRVMGRLEVLPSTNLFYILRDSPLSTDNRMKELVTFTDLNAENPITVVRPTVEGIDVTMSIVVDNGSHIKCWLNESRTNYLDIVGEGDMRMRYVNDQISLTGRYTIDEGEMKYSLPVIPLKTFRISEGSYLEFTGDILNPKLNITAIETKKASVNVEGVNKLVTFQTGVVISKTLNDIGLQFTINAPEDQTISDQLKMMSLEERGKQAVTMLTTGMYLSDGNTSSFSMNSALNSFLQSEISNIAGSALKTLDLSFGMDNSTEEDGTMHTNYSFKFAKRFWNNRLSVSVGGKISTGPDASGQSKSFFDNVEVQYRLSDISNQYLKLFYNRSVYDYLEGYVGQYGAGYMWKKKVQYLKDIFRKTSNTMPVRTTPTPQRPAPVSVNTTDSVQ